MCGPHAAIVMRGHGCQTYAGGAPGKNLTPQHATAKLPPNKEHPADTAPGSRHPKTPKKSLNSKSNLKTKNHGDDDNAFYGRTHKPQSAWNKPINLK